MMSFDGVLVATASAGTGKTTALIARLLGWSLGEGWARIEAKLSVHQSEWGELMPEDVAARLLSRVVCITFTEKAAAQMVEKFAEGLSLLRAGEALHGLDAEELPDAEILKGRIAALIACQDQLAVTTIHAFCRGILARHPLEARLHPGFVIDADKRILDDVCKDVVEHAVRASLEAGGEHDVIRLLLHGISPSDIAQALCRLVLSGVQPSDLAIDPLGPEIVIPFMEQLQSDLVHIVSLAGDRFEGGRTKAAKRAVSWCAALQDAVAPSDGAMEQLEAASAFVAEEFEDKIRATLSKWHKRDLTQSEMKALDERCSDFQSTASAVFDRVRRLKHVKPRLLQLGREAIVPLQAEVLERLRVQGVMTFPQLLSAAARVLRDHPSTVCAKERRRIDQLMVDEFQDTDEEQCSIIRMLALRGDPAHRPGLFLVGDPKQSIYGWRNADLSTYTRFIREVVEEHAAVMQPLSTNWRSCPEVIDEVNRVFGCVMKEEEGFQPAYAPLQLPGAQGRQFSLERASSWGPVEYWVSWGYDEATKSPLLKLNSEETSAFEADAVARDLLRLKASGGLSSWDEAMVLFRTGSALDRTLRAFREYGIPYAVERDKNYYRRREIIEASALVRTILDPMDHLAMMTLLRSATVGVPDAAWIALWQGLLPELFSRIQGTESPEIGQIRELAQHVANALPGEVPGLARVDGWHHSLSRAAKSVGVLRQALRELPSDQFVEELRHSFMIESVEGARYLGPYRVANLERFFRALGALMEEHGADKARVVRELRYQVSQQLDAEEAKPFDSGQDAVRVMTIHKSKGLKAKHVYMVGLHRTRGKPMGYESPGEKTRASQRTGPWEYMLFGAVTLGYQDLLDLEQRIDQAESIRTLYVGMTRAAERLVLVGRWPDPVRGKGRAAAFTHLESLQDTRPGVSSVLQGMEHAAIEGRSSFDADGVRWVFPALVGDSAPPSQVQANTSNLPELKDIERQLRDIVARRAVASEHQRRPLGAAVTALLDAHAPSTQEESTGEAGGLIASLAGTAVHSLMERFELGRDPGEELNRQLDGLRSEVAALTETMFLGEDQKEAVYQRARSCLEDFSQTELFEHFGGMADSILGREFPVLVPLSKDEGPIYFVNGIVDMLYRDPVDGGFVVVDYKTDEVSEEEALEDRAQAYALQGEMYCAAVDQALESDRPARFELWFLKSGTRVPM